jgi:hypothetical protein
MFPNIFTINFFLTENTKMVLFEILGITVQEIWVQIVLKQCSKEGWKSESLHGPLNIKKEQGLHD